MLEQASYCYMLCKPSMLRKYGFHLVLSGEQYKTCDQIKHAIRTYRNALSVFKGSTWSYINDHVHFHIGQWYASLGMCDVAVQNMMEILACSHQSKATQELFLGDFLQTVEVNTREALWNSLEEEMLPSFSAAKSNWLELQSKLISKKNSQSNVCVAGEAVKVNIEFKNPLQISIPVSGVALICKHSDTTDEARSAENQSNIEKDNEIDHFRGMSAENTSFSVSEVDFSLGAGETTMVQLSVTPSVEGTLSILGVRWKLSGAIIGFHNFESSHPKKNIVKGRRKSNYSPNDMFKFMVIKSIPKLQGSVSHLPGKAYAGDLRQLVLELSNTSDFPVKNLKMKISHPRFLTIGNPEHINSDFPACLTKKVDSVSDDAQANPGIMPDTVFMFPEDTSIQGENPFLWPLWFRAAFPGDISLCMSIYYEIGDISSVIRYRTLRLNYNVQVLPSLDVSFQITPSRMRMQEFLVRLDVVNKTSSESFQNSRLLTSEANESAMHVRSDLSLVPQSTDNLVFNINSAPLINFHHFERLQQEFSNEDQGDLNTVDFVLISRSLKSDNSRGLSDPPCVMSHHACHFSTTSTGPISWLVDGPQTLQHDFSASFCEINLKMHLYNSSGTTAIVCIDTLDSAGSSGVVQPATSDILAGWHDVTPTSELKVSPNAVETKPKMALSLDSVSPYIWSGSSSTSLCLEPMSSVETPLQICVFSPGTYDLSSYVLNWKLSSKRHGDGVETIQQSGKCQGYKYYITVLQSS
ncbi:hypothetical protein PIB30_055534 [Stylosanthes scabra]|uniref:Trafficking protein particle complex subunit 8 n=1 Tax=Stylosanthes scabra TaxID=79078 RepID=A0ABU6SK82_9FABA|nr:hypothetical protein [Stylosanthes scabra]